MHIELKLFVVIMIIVLYALRKYLIQSYLEDWMQLDILYCIVIKVLINFQQSAQVDVWQTYG